jgi:PilZ domain-containing protein
MNEIRQTFERARAMAAAPLPTLTRRVHVRVQLPPAVAVYARVHGRTGAGATMRGVCSDISAGGLAMRVIEGGRFEVPQEGHDVDVQVEYEGVEATTTGRVVRASTQQLSVAFARADRDEEMNVAMLSLMARVVTRRVETFDRARFAGSLAARRVHQHFYGAGYLDVRVQPEARPWWQAVFLDFLVVWSERTGKLETGVIDRSFAATKADDPLSASAHVVRHAKPWRSLLEVASLIAARCVAAQPAHKASFALMQKTLAAASGR